MQSQSKYCYQYITENTKITASKVSYFFFKLVVFIVLVSKQIVEIVEISIKIRIYKKR
jgi:hypothetical protein